MQITDSSKPLVALICGFEHSGTTLLTEILRQHPKLDSGFEGGFLLNEEAKDFLTTEPYCQNVKNGWGVSDADMHYICSGKTWAEVYARLLEKASVIKDKTTLLFDKTPNYMQKLPAVLKRVPDVPCLVIVRDFRSVFWSSFKRTGLSLEEWHKTIFPITCAHTMSYATAWRDAMMSGFEDRILLIKYESLCLDQVDEVQRIFNFLGIDFKESYLSFDKVRYEFVYGNSVSKQYLTEYQGKLPSYICEEILEVTREFKDWLWSN